MEDPHPIRCGLVKVEENVCIDVNANHPPP
jgi:hypothetical protein